MTLERKILCWKLDVAKGAVRLVGKLSKLGIIEISTEIGACNYIVEKALKWSKPIITDAEYNEARKRYQALKESVR